MTSPEVDVVIAVHRPERPLERAVRSVLLHTQADVRVTVVAHGLDPEIFRLALNEFEGDPRLRVVGFSDGVASPAGPMNHGFELATGDFTSLLGSDDEFAPGAIDRWLTDQRRHDASAVIARIDMVGGGTVPQPPVRCLRQGPRDPVRDRLAYRSAPLGLVSTKEFGELRLTEGLGTGEDLAYTAKIWFSGRRIVFAGAYEGYLGHSDGEDRVTGILRPVSHELEGVSRLITDPELQGIQGTSRDALGIKLLRVQIIGALAARSQLSFVEQTYVRELLDRLRSFAPGVERFLSIAEHRLIKTALSGGALNDAILRWQRKFTIASIWTNNFLYVFHAQSPLRYGIASLVVRARGAR